MTNINLPADAAASCRRALHYVVKDVPLTDPPGPQDHIRSEVERALTPVLIRAMQRAEWDVIPANQSSSSSIDLGAGLSLLTAPAPLVRHAQHTQGSYAMLQAQVCTTSRFDYWRRTAASVSHPKIVAQAAVQRAALVRSAQINAHAKVVFAAICAESGEWDIETIAPRKLDTVLANTRLRLETWTRNLAENGPVPEPDHPANSRTCKKCPFRSICRGTNRPRTLAQAAPAVKNVLVGSAQKQAASRTRLSEIASTEGVSEFSVDVPGFGRHRVEILESRTPAVKTENLHLLKSFLTEEQLRQVVTDSVRRSVRVTPDTPDDTEEIKG